MTWTPIDTAIALTGALAAMACAIPGTFLMLRRMSLMGDAISHAVLPGLAVAFLLTGTRDNLPMFIGACVVGLLTAFLVQVLTRTGNVEEGAAAGVVFTTLFALGLVLIRKAADRVDLDPNCVLFGSIELAPLDVVPLFGWELPRAAITAGGILLANALFVGLLYKELRLVAFDPALARAMGLPVGLLHYAQMALVAATCVATFESVGSILVIAMLLVPAATAHLLTDRLSLTLVLAVALAAVGAVLGHLGAIALPELLGLPSAPTAGMIATASGLLFLGALLLAPRHGVLARAASQFRLRLRIAREDALENLWRALERTPASPALAFADLASHGANPWLLRLALTTLRSQGLVLPATAGADRWLLSPAGESRARELVRTHRLWEGWLHERLGVPAERVHAAAERLEHVTTSELQETLRREATGTSAGETHKPTPD